MKKLFSLQNFIFLIILGFLVYKKAPLLYESYKMEGQNNLYLSSLQNLQGEKIPILFPQVVVFWASWCKPCELELGRINDLIKEKSILSNQVIAISVDQNKSELMTTIKERGYLFPVAWDPTGGLSQRFKVVATPTLFVFGKDKSILWATSGISPTLGVRLKNYLNNYTNSIK